MEDKRQDTARRLGRVFETNRLEEQLWARAYEEVWPIIWRSLKRASVEGQTCQEVASYIARRA